MAPRFSKPIVATLKTTLRSRASEDYRFREGDVEELTVRTGLNAAQIRDWNAHTNRYYATERQKADFLAGNEKVITQTLQDRTQGKAYLQNHTLSILSSKSYNILYCDRWRT